MVTNLYVFSGWVFSNNFFSKLFLGFQFWTFLKMSIFKNPKHFPEKSHFVTDNVRKIFVNYFFVSINFHSFFWTFLKYVHILAMFGNENSAKFCNKYFCEICNYNTSRKSSYDTHLLSAKHQKSMIGNENSAKICNQNYVCISCQKEYKDYSGLWRHRKKCNIVGNDNSSPDKDFIKELIKQNMLLITQHEEFKELIKEQTHQILELSKNQNITTSINNGTINNSNTNSHNKFNLNVFLNETCKNAMNINDFVNSIQPTLEDLENVGRVGYAEGISNIIINKLNKIEITKRPIHCSDTKREVTYIKNDNIWSKESDDKPILLKAIKDIAYKNIQNIVEWKKANPGCTDADSRKNDMYLNIVSNSMCGLTKEETNKNFNKIVSNLSKKITISEFK